MSSALLLLGIVIFLPAMLSLGLLVEKKLRRHHPGQDVKSGLARSV